MGLTSSAAVVSCGPAQTDERIDPLTPAYRKLEASPTAQTIDVSVDVSWTGDLPHRYVDRPAPPKPDQKQLAGVQRPAFERHDLPNRRVAARVWKKPKGPPGVGFVTNASVTGMWIETDTSLPLRTQVQVELHVPGGYSATLIGRVIRANDKGMAVHLNTEDSTWQFRSSFLELARREEGQAPSVIVRTDEASEEPVATSTPESEAVDFRVLGVKWHEVLADLKDDAIHQEFIQECLRRQRLEFGLERYRELKGGPEDAVAAKYLGQIGVILGFMSLKKDPAKDDEKRTKTLKLMLLCISVLGALLLAQRLWVAKTELPSDVMAPQPQNESPPPVEEKAEWELPKSER